MAGFGKALKPSEATSPAFSDSSRSLGHLPVTPSRASAIRLKLWTILGQAAAFLVAVPIASFLWIIAGPQPLDFRTMVLDGTDVAVRGEVITLRAEADKPFWSAQFCTALSGTVNMIDSMGIIRQATAAANYNDGRVHTHFIPVMIPLLTAIGPMTFQSVTIYSCLGVTRTVYSPVLVAPVVAAAP